MSAEYYTLGELAELFKVHHETIRRWRREKRFKAIQTTPRGRVRVHRSEVERFKASMGAAEGVGAALLWAALLEAAKQLRTLVGPSVAGDRVKLTSADIAAANLAGKALAMADAMVAGKAVVEK